MSLYVCPHCKVCKVPDLTILAETVGGSQWWTVPQVDALQADALHRLIAEGHCERHAALIAACVAMVVRREAALRVVYPGTVEVRRTALDAEPFEAAPQVKLHKAIRQLRSFVSGTELAAVVELDEDRHRMRINIQLITDAGQPSETIDTRQLRAMTPATLIRLMRENERRRAAR